MVCYLWFFFFNSRNLLWASSVKCRTEGVHRSTPKKGTQEQVEGRQNPEKVNIYN